MARRPTIAESASEVEEAVAVRAVLIDPGAESIMVSFVHMPTRPAHPLQLAHGLQLEPKPVAELLGSRLVVLHRLPAGEALLTTPRADGQTWWLGSIGPHRGRGIIVRWERIADQVNDTMLGLEEVGALIEIEDDEAEETGDGHAAAA